MEKNRSHNVIWILIDSVRAKKTGGDDRDRLDIMDCLGNDFTEFKNVMTSAPSTIMSLSAMMTGLPSIYLSKTYNDFSMDYDYFRTIPQIIRENGFIEHGAIYYREGRELLHSLFTPFEKKIWPKRLRHSNLIWSNKIMKNILKNYLSLSPEKQFFLYLHFNCRADKDTTFEVEESLEIIKKHGYFDNSIILICSDHGYPNPDSGYTEKKFKDMNVGHDLVMGDDNIMIPLFIRHPMIKPQVINELVSTIDLAPTILDMLNIEDERFQRQSIGTSFFSKAESSFHVTKKKMYPRSDNRFLFQNRRVTVLRNNNYKYSLHHDEKIEELVDLSEDNNEKLISSENNSLSSQILKKFRIELSKYDSDIKSFQEKFLEKCLASNKALCKVLSMIKSDENVFILTTLDASNGELYLNTFNKYLNYNQLSLVTIHGEDGHINYSRLQDIKSKNTWYFAIIGADSIKKGYVKDILQYFSFSQIKFLTFDLLYIPRFFPKINILLNKLRPRKIFYIDEPVLLFKDLFDFLKRYRKS